MLATVCGTWQLSTKVSTFYLRALARPSYVLRPDVTPHVFRHSFASLAADMGYSEPTIAALIGHAGRSMTSRYVHSADAVLLAAAEAVARRTLELLGEGMGGIVVELAAWSA